MHVHGRRVDPRLQGAPTMNMCKEQNANLGDAGTGVYPRVLHRMDPDIYGCIFALSQLLRDAIEGRA